MCFYGTIERVVGCTITLPNDVNHYAGIGEALQSNTSLEYLELDNAVVWDPIVPGLVEEILTSLTAHPRLGTLVLDRGSCSNTGSARALSGLLSTTRTLSRLVVRDLFSTEGLQVLLDGLRNSRHGALQALLFGSEFARGSDAYLTLIELLQSASTAEWDGFKELRYYDSGLVDVCESMVIQGSVGAAIRTLALGNHQPLLAGRRAGRGINHDIIAFLDCLSLHASSNRLECLELITICPHASAALSRCLPALVHLRTLKFTFLRQTRREKYDLTKALKANGSLYEVPLSPSLGPFWKHLEAFTQRNQNTPLLLAHPRLDHVQNVAVLTEPVDASGTTDVEAFSPLFVAAMDAPRTAPNNLLIGLLATVDSLQRHNAISLSTVNPLFLINQPSLTIPCVAMAAAGDDTTEEVWFCRHVGADFVGSAASVELDCNGSGSVRPIRLKQIREAAQQQYPRTVGKYESTEIVMFHFGALAPSNSIKRQISASAIPLNPGYHYDVNVHGGTKDSPIVFHIVAEPDGYPTAATKETTEAIAKISDTPRLPSEPADVDYNSDFSSGRRTRDERAQAACGTSHSKRRIVDGKSIGKTAEPSKSDTSNQMSHPETVVLCGGSGSYKSPGNVAFRKAAMAVYSDYRLAIFYRDTVRRDSIVNELMRQFSFRKGDRCVDVKVARSKIVTFMGATRPLKAQKVSKITSASIPKPPVTREQGAQTSTSTLAIQSASEHELAMKPSSPHCYTGGKRVVVQCGLRYRTDPGHIAFHAEAVWRIPEYLLADDSRRISMVDEFQNRFDFRQGKDKASEDFVRHRIATLLSDYGKVPKSYGVSSQAQGSAHVERDVSQDKPTVDDTQLDECAFESASHMDDDEDDDDMSDTPAIVIRHHKKLVRSHLAPMLKTDVEDRDHQTLISADDIVAVGINEGTTDRPSSTTETHHERANLGIAGRTGSFYEETACCTESDDLELFAA